MSVSTVLAKALYDNIAESSDELSFRRGEILMVVERETAGLGGWWLCSLHGRLGIVPGNRLKLLEGDPREASAGLEDNPASRPLEGLKVEQAGPPFQDSNVYQVPPALEGSKVSWATPPPQKSEVCQVPPSLRGSQVRRGTLTPVGSGVNRTPASADPGRLEAVAWDREVPVLPEQARDSGSDFPEGATENEYAVPDSIIYNVPTLAAPSEREAEEGYKQPSISRCSAERLLLRDILPLPHHHNGKDGAMPTGHQEIYKSPRSLTHERGRAVETYDVPTGLWRNVSPAGARAPPLTMEVYDSPRQSPGTISTQPLSERLAGLRLSVTEGISRLMEAVGRGLGGRHLCEAASSGVSEASGALGCSLIQLVSACRASRPCCPALETHLRGLEEAQALLGELGRRLEAWQHRPEAGGDGGRSLSGLRDLSQFAGVAERISHHLEASACLLDPASQAQGQAGPRGPGLSQSAFRRPLPPLPEPGCKAGIQTRPLPPTPAYAPEEKHAEDANVYEGVGPCRDEHEYVHLQGKDSADGCREEALKAKETVQTVDQSEEMQDSEGDSLPAADRPLVAFYAQQCNGHLATLLGAIEGLVSCLRSSQPPRVFVRHGRHVVVSAHKLVFIGDALSRQARGAGVRSRVGRAGALLCQALRETVQATKGAAQRYPELPAVQDMADKVTELSQHALRFTQLLGELTA